MKRYYVLLYIVTAMLFPHMALALGLGAYTEVPEVRVGDTFAVEIFLDAAEENVNAFVGSLNYSDTLQFVETRYLGSIVPLWLKQPSITAPRTLGFEGVIPGGYQGVTEKRARGNLFTLVFVAKKEGEAKILFNSDSTAYINDGEGTKIPFVVKPLVLVVQGSNQEPKAASLGTDTTAPEPFVPQIVSGELFLVSGPVLIFSTQDKDSGLKKYEVAHSYFRGVSEQKLLWQEAVSPHELTDEELGSYVFVRASDYAGNTYTAKVGPQRVSLKGILINAWLPLLLSVCALGIVLWSKRTRKKIIR